MLNKRTELYAGIFVLLGITVFFLSVINFGGKDKFFTKYYYLVAELSNTQGLAPGSLVSLAGLPVGNVESLNIHPERPTIQVLLKIEEAFKQRIFKDSVARIKTQGALGDRYIYIEPGKSHEPLNDGDLIIAEAPIDFFDVLADSTKEAGNVGDLIKEVHSLFKNINDQDRSAILMNNLAAASGSMRLLMADPKLKETISRLHGILQKIDRGEGTLGRLVNDPTLYDKLLKMTGESPRNQYFKSLMRESVIQQ
jgi:phospholipid/cholesterol/gamma-HCH transport system substrate-binding protein